MGTGRFKDGKLDFTVVANFAMTAGDWTAWERTFRKASELLWNASEGQVSFGKVFVSDESTGLYTAEAVLHDSGDPSYATTGGYGSTGQAMHLMPYVCTAGPLSILHELGHHIWSLGEEYSSTQTDTIDTISPAPDNFTIPIVDSGRGDDDLVGASAVLKFGALVERRAITANTSTTVTVNPAFSQDPITDTNSIVTYQFNAKCSAVANSSYCIMENSRGAAGIFDGAGTWVPDPNPVTEFCTDSNHDPDGDTDQEYRHGESCWEHIVRRTEFTGLTVPDPASAVDPAEYEELDWIVLDKQPRFSLVLDRSGSMGSGNKMADAQHGAVYWVEFCALSDDLLSIHWYDHNIDDILTLTEVSTLGGLQPQFDAINALTPGGATNIRDGLLRASDEIQSLPTRAAVQVALLLTDGVHNTPRGSSATEAVPELSEAGVRVYALGVGDPADVDLPTLEALATGTGGRSYGVGDDQPGEIEAAMIEINAEVRGGIVTTAPSSFPDAKRSRADSLFARFNKAVGNPANRRKSRAKLRPAWEEVMDALRLEKLGGLRRASQVPDSRVRVFTAVVERGAERASFSLTYPEPGQVWLYLLDPRGKPFTGPRLQHIVSDAPHEFAVVTKPRPGVWHIVAVRAKPGAAFTVRAIAGVENRGIQAFGGVRDAYTSSGSVGLWAHATAGHRLSGLDVSARIVDPKGAVHRVQLSDCAVGEPQSGDYSAVFSADVPGRHRGVLRIACSGRASRAGAVRHMLHAECNDLDLSVQAPRFFRAIPFSFEVGPCIRPQPTPGPEVPGRDPVPRKRRVPLVSAKPHKGR